MSAARGQRPPYQRPQPAPAPAPQNPEGEEISGEVESIVYRNEENGYTICRVKAQGQRNLVTMVGSCSAMWVGESLHAAGKWIRHPQHGFQFKSEAITCMAPTTIQGIERYLGSGMIRGIGKVNAKRLVAHFGDQTLDIIEKESARLEEVEGIGPVRRRLIKASWGEKRGVRDVMIFMQGHGIGTAQATRIYRQYGQDAIALIKSNPYRLCYDIWGIGFKTADAVAMSVGIPRDSIVRARAGVTHVLQTMTEEGHCFCPEAELLLSAEVLLEIPVETLAEGLKAELDEGFLVKEEDLIFLKAIFKAETTVSTRLTELCSAQTAFRPIDADKAVNWAAERLKMDFAPMQHNALLTSLSEKVSIITGGPGVGKTTIITALVAVFDARNLRIELAAPTGRAAKRMEEATQHSARTIHRLLKYKPQKRAFDHDASNPLDCHVVIIDEVSMIDIHLMADLLSALPNSAALVIVGDTDQLPSVGPGNVLRDMIASGKLPYTHLETIFRQKSGGGIVQNAHRVNRGEFIEVDEESGLSDFYFVEADDPEQMIRAMVGLVSKRIPERFGLDPCTDIQVLTPMRRNQLGTENLNAILQEALNPTGHDVERYGRHYRKGDRVMQVRNNYDKEVFNGDIGHIAYVNEVDQEIHVDFDGSRVKYEFSELDELIHAYACSIHKSQGSEYPAVVLLISTHHFKLLQRNLLYTGLTRGRKLVCLVGSRKAVWMAIQNNEIGQRRTQLCRRLAERPERPVQ
jgi:exodeoxyribonuclease V alpha subunit